MWCNKLLYFDIITIWEYMCVSTSWMHIYEYLILLCKIGCDTHGVRSVCPRSRPWNDQLHLQGLHTKSPLWPETGVWSPCLGKGHFNGPGNSSCSLSCHCYVEGGTHYPKWSVIPTLPEKDRNEWSFQVLYVDWTQYTVWEEDDGIGNVLGAHDLLYGN